MTPFAYYRATSAENARAAMRPGARYLAGGTSLIDLMKTGAETPDLLVDLNRGAGLGGLDWLPDGTLRAGAAVRMTALARDPLVARRFPVLHQGLLAGATPQLRNMASLAGQPVAAHPLLLLPRSLFCRLQQARSPGTGCAALHGVNADHAVLGWTEACVAVHPSDLAVAMLALDVRVATDRRTLALELRYTAVPGSDPRVDTVLDGGELILALEVPAGPRAVAVRLCQVASRRLRAGVRRCGAGYCRGPHLVRCRRAGWNLPPALALASRPRRRWLATLQPGRRSPPRPMLCIG